MVMTCEMVRVVPDGDGMGQEMPPCGRPRRRRTCCDECFEKFISSGEFTRAEAEREYPTPEREGIVTWMRTAYPMNGHAQEWAEAIARGEDLKWSEAQKSV